nr:hypothetical protein [Nanoarchaeum sp.]
MNMSKKGVSPLVATILLVAMVIVIALLIFWWYGDIIGKQLEKSKIDLETVCVEDLDYSVTEIDCRDVSGGAGDDRIISFYVRNSGTTRIGSFKIDISGNTGNSITEDVGLAIAPGVKNKVSFEVPVIGVDGIGKSLEMDVTPMVYGNGKTRYCSEKVQKLSVQCE